MGPEQLSGVMAHEIAHVAACHAARGRTRAKLIGVASISMSMIGGPVAFAAYEGKVAWSGELGFGVRPPEKGQSEAPPAEGEIPAEEAAPPVARGGDEH